MSDFVLDTKVLDQLIAEGPERVDKAIRATGFAVAGNAINLVARDTGATADSIFVSTSKGKMNQNGGPFDESKAAALNPKAEIGDPTPGKPPLMTCYVAPGTNYAIWIEIGTSKMPARPYMTPSVEMADQQFEGYIKKEFDL